MMEKRYCESCRAQLSRGSAMGLLGNRKDSATTISRRNSLAGGNRSRRPSMNGQASAPASRAGSRRPSVSTPGAAKAHGHGHSDIPRRSANYSGFAGLGF
jgi:hypothetical protein